MTVQNDLDRMLGAWFDDDAAAALPLEPLARVLEATSGLRPRPSPVAAFGSHWIGEATLGIRAEAPRLPRPLAVALVLLLAAALVGAAAIVGSRLLIPRPAPLPDGFVDELVSAAGLSRPMARPVLAPLPNGRVLVMGAGGDGEDQTTSAEIYDPATGTSVSVGPMVPLQWVASATALNNGRVLVLDGQGVAQVFDPDTLRFSPAGAMVTPRPDTVAALLLDGRVLVVGGGLRSAELFDPHTLTFSQAGTMAATPVENAAIATLPDGRVFVPAGVATIPDTEWAIEAEIYDPTAETFSAAGRTPDFGVAAAIAMPDGRVLVVGGGAAAWDPATRAFSPVAGPPGGVSRATLLDDGRILLLGFVQFPRDPSTCQVSTQHACSWAGIYDPATGATTLVAPPTAWSPSLTRLTDGRVLVVGGLVNGDIGPAPAANGAPAVQTVQIYQ